MLKEKIKNSKDFTEEEKKRLLLLLEKDVINTNFVFPETYTVNIGYDKDHKLYPHIIKKNPGNVPEMDDCEYLLIMVKDDEYIIVDGGSSPIWWKADNTEEIELLAKELEESIS